MTQKWLFFFSYYSRKRDRVFAILFVFFLPIINTEIIFKEFLGLLNVIKARIFYIHETAKNIMIDEYENFMHTIF